MKKTFVVLLSIIGFNALAVESSTSLLSSPTYTKIVRTNRGLFGYKYVDQQPSSGNDVYLLCSDPGSHRCKLSEAMVVSSGLSNANLETIQEMVDQRILDNAGIPGNFVFNSDYYVSYSFVLSTGQSKIEIYTRTEANAINITF
jgi:hypothetical protein